MNHDTYNNEYIRSILRETKTIAIVGASPKPERDSNRVMQYLAEKGYKVFPVNPGHAGKEIAGHTCYASLSDIPYSIDMVDIFRKPDALAGIVSEALALSPLPKTIWMQLGLRNDEAARLAEEKDIKVIMNRCPKIEYPKLMP